LNLECVQNVDDGPIEYVQYGGGHGDSDGQSYRRDGREEAQQQDESTVERNDARLQRSTGRLKQ